MKTRYAYELHLHTGEFGWCAQVPAATIVPSYEALGYDGIVVTNHYFDHGFEAMPETTWAGKIDNYLRGYEAARAAVTKQDFDVLLGLEMRFTESFNDYLIYGVNKQQLIDHPELYNYTPAEFRKLADKLGWAFIQAHPYRNGCKIIAADLLHGIEVNNENPRHNSRNELALRFANENSLVQTGGSDYHQIGDEGLAAVSFDERITTSEQLAAKLLADYKARKMKKAAHAPRPEILIQPALVR